VVGETNDERVAMGTFYSNLTTREGAAHRVLIEPALDDPYTALCITRRFHFSLKLSGGLSEWRPFRADHPTSRLRPNKPY
jgi:hypothetical protein